MSRELTRIEYTFKNRYRVNDPGILVVFYKNEETLSSMGRWQILCDGHYHGYLPDHVEPSESVARVIFAMVPEPKEQ